MRKSIADTAETRKRIVSTASKVFLSRGLAATGIADIMTAAGLTPGGFYRHFESKEQLVAEANSAAFEQLSAMFEARVAGKSPKKALDTIVHIYLHQLQGEEPEFLCPLANIGSELQQSDEHIKGIAMAGYKSFVRTITGLVQQLNVADPGRIAAAIVSTLVGAVTLSRLALDTTAENAILKNAERTVSALLRSSPTATLDA